MADPKALVGSPARSLIKLAGTLAHRANALLHLPGALRQEAERQVEAIRSEATEQQLVGKSIAELRKMLPRGTRTGALETAGYRTIADVLRNRSGLIAVPGVGPQTAQAVEQAAESVANQVRQDIRVALDPDHPTPAHTELLATLAAIRAGDDAVGSLRSPIEAYLQQATPLIEAAGPGTSRIKMFFRGSQRKSIVLSALGELDQLVSSPSFHALSRAIDDAEQRIQEPPPRLWREFERNAATFTTLLSTVGGAAGTDDKEAAAGFVPAELRRKIGMAPLDQRLLKATLRGYQLFGAQYMIHQRNAILGDEMGLGKTLQALAAMAHLAANGQKRFLVVCPASVQLNWLNEIERHTRLRGLSLHGSGRDAEKRKWLRSGGVAVTTFGTLGALKLTNIDLAMLVVDEAHYVKNPNAARTKAVRSVIRLTDRTLFLSGTPMENRVEEFRNLVSYINPTVRKRVSGAEALAGARAFRRAVSSVYLRRNQEDVLQELPDKIEVEDWVEPSGADLAAYRKAVESKNLMRMRAVSAREAKLERIAEIVEEAEDDGLKVIVFSYFLDTLNEINEQIPGVFGPLTGSVAPAARQQLVDQFTAHRGPAALLCQIEAGGVGLNVQAASVVIIVEPQWKPSTEEQAIARAHRMGQVRKVQVHRLLAKESVDERIREIQQHKSLLFGEFARKSDAKLSDKLATETKYIPPTEAAVVAAEARRLGLAS